jgi:hypothetical protein
MPAPNSDKWDSVRFERLALFPASDIVATRYFKAGQPFPAEWQTYTQALRDITLQDDPAAVVWPAIPTTPLPQGI